MMIFTSTNAIIPPSSGNNKRGNQSPNTTTHLTKKQMKAIDITEQKELNMKRIVETNKKIILYNDTTIMTTTSEIKPYLTPTKTNNIFIIDNYVDVQGNFSCCPQNYAPIYDGECLITQQRR